MKIKNSHKPGFEFNRQLALYVRQEREKRGWTREMLAREATRLGLLDWCHDVVLRIEYSIRQLSVVEFITLPMIFLPMDPGTTPAGDRPLFSLAVSDNLRRKRMDLSWRLEDVAMRACSLGLDWTTSTVSAIEHGTRGLSLDEYLMSPWIYSDCDLSWGSPVKEDEYKHGLAEQKAARKLGKTVEEIRAAALHLWSRSLTEERDRVARQAETGPTARSLQALRGSITRKLIKQIEGHLTR